MGSFNAILSMKHVICGLSGENVPHEKRNGKFDRFEMRMHKKTLEMNQGFSKL